MKTIVIINTISIWLIIIFMIIKPYLQKFTIQINRTFWEKKPYGFHITKWKYKRDIIPNSGRGIFHFNWRNPDNISDDMGKARSNR